VSCLVVSHERIETNRIELASIPIVKGFQDIFSKELLGLPQLGKLKFQLKPSQESLLYHNLLRTN
jgi:hypothetical protein